MHPYPGMAVAPPYKASCCLPEIIAFEDAILNLLSEGRAFFEALLLAEIAAHCACSLAWPLVSPRKASWRSLALLDLLPEGRALRGALLLAEVTRLSGCRSGSSA